jgi:proteic killer suppression protein
MIKTFAYRHTQGLYETGRSKRLPLETWKKDLRELEYFDLATHRDDSRVPQSNRLHELERDRKGKYEHSEQEN